MTDIKNYNDASGRHFNSMPELCRKNDIDYNLFYRLVQNHGMSTEDACRTLLIEKEIETSDNLASYLDKDSPLYTDSSIPPRDNAPNIETPEFTPNSNYPSKAYLEYIKYELHTIQNNRIPKDTFYFCLKEILKTEEILERELEEIQNNGLKFDLFDRWCLGDKSIDDCRFIKHLIALTDRDSTERDILYFSYKYKILDKQAIEKRKKALLSNPRLNPDPAAL